MASAGRLLARVWLPAGRGPSQDGGSRGNSAQGAELHCRRRGREPEGRASGRAASEVGRPSALARSGPARSEAVAGEGTGGADWRVEGGKRASEVPVRAAAARVPSPSGLEALGSLAGSGFVLAAAQAPAQARRPPGLRSQSPTRGGGPVILPGRVTYFCLGIGRILSLSLKFSNFIRIYLGLGVILYYIFLLHELNKNPVEGFSAGLIDDNDLYRWEVLIIGPPDTLYEGGVFKAHLTFPKDYPLRPPKMKFITEIWHPNVDKNGDVCISILHEPGEDKYGYEKPEERWLPIHTVETIMISVISMLADPNGDSPANVDAAKEWREDRNGEFKRKVARCVRKSQETAFE
uniref:ubiquitin-conjugating enzyme E2 G1 n=1 Tax=Ictidomys tridecemlineatus TaxID=43179 RepID=UPI001A9EDD57|nr:ubiquitin-conjugating enzyme E2 G1 [Ictidomys tridecemlineatus]